MSLKTIQDFEFKNQRVFLRLDLNVPLQDGQITDDTRIRASLPVIEELRSKGAKLVLASHLGRPKGAPDKKYSLEPVAARLSELLGCEVLLMDTPTGEAVKGLLTSLRSNQILLLENLRFDPGEEKNSIELAQGWASFTDIYVNDAFGASHREHASISALPRLVEKKAMGPLIQREVQALDRLLKGADKPFAALLGGAKVSDKIGLIESLMDKVDKFLVGGAMAYTFLAAMDIPVGKSRIEKDKVRFAKDLMERLSARGKTLALPVDHVTVTSLEEKVTPRVTEGAAIGDDELAVDIGPKTRASFAKVLEDARMVFWNGPMGIFEKEPFGEGTLAMARALASLKGTYKVVGGGDSVAAVQQSGLADEFDHISTGGGASLEYLEAGELPGIKVLKS
jgi:phosphoglycerate kinase